MLRPDNVLVKKWQHLYVGSLIQYKLHWMGWPILNWLLCNKPVGWVMQRCCNPLAAKPLSEIASCSDLFPYHPNSYYEWCIYLLCWKVYVAL